MTKTFLRQVQALEAAMEEELRALSDAPSSEPPASPAPSWLLALRRQGRPAPVRACALQAGQVWRVTHAHGLPALCVLLAPEGAQWRAALAHEHLWLASDEDVICTERDSPTGEALVVCPRWGWLVSEEALTGGALGQVPSALGEVIALGEVHASVAPRAPHEEGALVERLSVGGSVYLSASREASAEQQRALAKLARASFARQLEPGWLERLWGRLSRAMAPVTAPMQAGEGFFPALSLAGATLRAEVEAPEALTREFELSEGALSATLCFEFDGRALVLSAYVSVDGEPASGAEVTLERDGDCALRLLTDEAGLGMSEPAQWFAAMSSYVLHVRCGALTVTRAF